LIGHKRRHHVDIDGNPEPVANVAANGWKKSAEKMKATREEAAVHALAAGD
jgi:hypothetical protein